MRMACWSLSEEEQHEFLIPPCVVVHLLCVGAEGNWRTLPLMSTDGDDPKRVTAPTGLSKSCTLLRTVGGSEDSGTWEVY